MAAQDQGPFLGGLEDIDLKANEVELESLARFAVDEHNKKENAVLQLKRLLSAKKQVVAGTMYYLTLEVTDGDTAKVYEARVWEKPWENFKQLVEFKVQSLGGLEDIDLKANEVELEGLARFAVDEHNKKENAVLQLKRLLSAKKQVVAGTMYYLTLEVTDGDTAKVYEARVWEKPWENFKQLVEFKVQSLGGLEDIDLKANEVELEGLARFAVDEHNKKENAVLQLKRLLSAKKQVVAGTMYYLTLKVTDGDTAKVYEARVWEKLWENFKQLVEFKEVTDIPTQS